MAELSMEQLLHEMVEKGASDLHLSVGSPPYFRINKKLVAGDYPPLKPEDTRTLVYSVLNDAQKKKFEEEWELDFAISVPGLSRFRANVFFQRGSVACAIRRIPFEIPPLERLGLPKVVEELLLRPRGLVLVTGPTGSGKSTTLAAMIDRINTEQDKHIITIEDPIEYLHRNKKSIVAQREVGQDTRSFATALKYVLRQDPDVIMVGEMRDQETIFSALVAAETGHLVFGTLHTDSATESVNRIIDVFPPHQQQQVRIQLSQVIEGVITQRLLPRADGQGLVLAAEVMIATPAIRTLIREARVHEIYGVIQTSQRFGMQTLNASLYALYRQGLITWQDALSVSSNPEELKRMIGRF